MRRRLRARKPPSASRTSAKPRATRAGTHGEGARIDGGKARRVQGERRGGDPPRRRPRRARAEALEARCSAAESARDEAAARFAAAAAGEGEPRGAAEGGEEAAERGEAELAEEVKTAKMTRLMFRWRNQATSHAFIAWRARGGSSAIATRWRRRWPAGGGACSSRFPSTIGAGTSLQSWRSGSGSRGGDGGSRRARAKLVASDPGGAGRRRGERAQNARAADAEAALERATIGSSPRRTSRCSTRSSSSSEGARQETNKAENEAGENNIRYLANQLKACGEGRRGAQDGERRLRRSASRNPQLSSRAWAKAATRRNARLSSVANSPPPRRFVVAEARRPRRDVKFDDATAGSRGQNGCRDARETARGGGQDGEDDAADVQVEEPVGSHAFVARGGTTSAKGSLATGGFSRRSPPGRTKTGDIGAFRPVGRVDAGSDRRRREEELERTKEDADTIRVGRRSYVAELGKFKAKPRDAMPPTLRRRTGFRQGRRRGDREATPQRGRRGGVHVQGARAAEGGRGRRRARSRATRSSQKVETAELREKISTLERSRSGSVGAVRRRRRDCVEAGAGASRRERERGGRTRMKSPRSSEFAKLAGLVHRWRAPSRHQALSPRGGRSREVARQQGAVSKVATR